MATINQRGKSWVLNWREGGIQYRRSLGQLTRAEAEIYRKAKEVELATGQNIISSATTFSEFADEYLTWHEAEYAESHYRIRQIINDHLRPFFQLTNLDGIEPRLVEAYKASRRKHVKTGTIVKELRTLQAILNRAVEWGAIAVNPARHVRPPKGIDSRPPIWFTPEQLKAIYKADQRFSALWRLLANTGLRRSELMALRWEHVTDTALHVLSQEGARTKSGKWREIPLSQGAKTALNRLRDENGASPYVAPRVRKENLSVAFARTLERAGIKEGSLHSLRHTFGSTLVQRGVALRTVQILMGHSTVAVTERYAHLAPSHLAAAVKGLRL